VGSIPVPWERDSDKRQRREAWNRKRANDDDDDDDDVDDDNGADVGDTSTGDG
jgi:hypothetical protein